MLKKIDKKGQVWVETVVYTLIGLVLISTILAFAVPQIEKQKDKIIVDRSVELMNTLDNQIQNIKRLGVGNSRELNLGLSDGQFIISPPENTIVYVLEESKYEYSEVGRDINIPGSNLIVRTEEVGDRYKVSLTLDYSNAGILIKYDGEEIEEIFDSVAIPYLLGVENIGREDLGTSCIVDSGCGGSDEICIGGYCHTEPVINIVEKS